MKKLAGAFFGLVLLLSIGNVGYATVLVDTGLGTTNWSFYNNGFSSSWYAGEFSIESAYTITDIEAYLSSIGGGSATVALYTDGGSIPGTELYSNSFTADSSAGWYGVNNMSWDLSAGTYWAAFEVRSGQSFSGGLRASASSPIGNEAYATNATWYSFDDLNMSLKIIGSPVPEPATMLLFGTGLLGLAGISRKKS